MPPFTKKPKAKVAAKPSQVSVREATETERLADDMWNSSTTGGYAPRPAMDDLVEWVDELQKLAHK